MALVGYSKWAIRITFHPCAVSRGPIISTKTRGIGVFKCQSLYQLNIGCSRETSMSTIFRSCWTNQTWHITL